MKHILFKQVNHQGFTEKQRTAIKTFTYINVFIKKHKNKH